MKAVHRAYTVPGSLVLVASPGERQSAEFLRKAAAFVARLAIRPQGDGDNEISLVLPNGSRIVGLAGTEMTVRGYSAVSLLLIDEASRVADSLYKALRPMLAVSDGDLWLMSTPYGKRGFFYESWMHGGEGWERITVTATECGRISNKFLEEERRELGNIWFRQEYLCEFVDNGGAVFERDVVEGALDEHVEEWDLMAAD
ncbi:MAG TPA: terminase family protein [Bryobacteraceae bacterium]|nr:terminase family protein [Bryobacteraceae bacterium]